MEDRNMACLKNPDLSHQQHFFMFFAACGGDFSIGGESVGCGTRAYKLKLVSARSFHTANRRQPMKPFIKNLDTGRQDEKRGLFVPSVHRFRKTPKYFNRR